MTKDPIAAAIRRIIDERGLVQKMVALRAGYTPQQFSDMLNNRKVIRASDMKPIAVALGVTVQEIFDAGRDFDTPDAV